MELFADRSLTKTERQKLINRIKFEIRTQSSQPQLSSMTSPKRIEKMIVEQPKTNKQHTSMNTANTKKNVDNFQKNKNFPEGKKFRDTETQCDIPKIFPSYRDQPKYPSSSPKYSSQPTQLRETQEPYVSHQSLPGIQSLLELINTSLSRNNSQNWTPRPNYRYRKPNNNNINKN